MPFLARVLSSVQMCSAKFFPIKVFSDLKISILEAERYREHYSPLGDVM